MLVNFWNPAHHFGDFPGLVPQYDSNLTCDKVSDDLIKSGEPGGREAVQRLRDSGKKHLEGNIPDLQHDLQVIVRVCANMKGLSKTYCDAGPWI